MSNVEAGSSPSTSSSSLSIWLSYSTWVPRGGTRAAGRVGVRPRCSVASTSRRHSSSLNVGEPLGPCLVGVELVDDDEVLASDRADEHMCPRSSLDDLPDAGSFEIRNHPAATPGHPPRALCAACPHPRAGSRTARARSATHLGQLVEKAGPRHCFGSSANHTPQESGALPSLIVGSPVVSRGSAELVFVSGLDRHLVERDLCRRYVPRPPQGPAGSGRW